jgi:23S rRNA pseudouridine1911/1915/1917 synthase
MFQNNSIIVSDYQGRIDKYLTIKLEISRSQIEQFIKNGYMTINQKVVKKSGELIRDGDKITLNSPQKEIDNNSNIVDFDVEVIYEDDDILVINKQPNLVIHPCSSYKSSTLVDWLKLRGISLSNISNEDRHGIVHRIDKETSGALVVAKNNESHIELSNQLQTKTMGRYYLAVIDRPLKDNIIVDAKIGRNPNDRLKMGITRDGKDAKTLFKKISISKNNRYELITAKLYTGRTHQIRVHLSSLQRHIIGDYLYGFKGECDKIKRHFLHAYLLYLIHPKTNQRLLFLAPLFGDMRDFLNENFDEVINEKISKENILNIFGDFY